MTIAIIVLVLVVVTAYFFMRSRRNDYVSPFPKPEPNPEPTPEPTPAPVKVGRPLALAAVREEGGNRLTWNGNVSGGTQDGVFVYRTREGSSEVWLNTTPLAPGTEEFFDTTADPNSDYTYRVRNSYVGAWSEYSDPAPLM